MAGPHDLVLIGERRHAFGYRDGGAAGDGPHTQVARHLERVIHLVILRVQAHVVAEDLNIDAGIVELLLHAFPGCGIGRHLPIGNRLLRSFLLGRHGCGTTTSATATGRGRRTASLRDGIAARGSI